MRISVVIPCYNEEESIARVIAAIPPEVEEVIVVDNNSTDRTAAIARSLGARVVAELKQGYGRALKTGFRSARGEIIATLDGDSQYPAEFIIVMAERLKSNRLDFTSGNRFPLQIRGALPLTRIIGNKLFTLAANFLFSLQLRDSQSGMWVFRKAILDSITLESDDMPLSQELKIRVATDPRFAFREYHIPYAPRSGRSKLVPLRHGIINLIALLKLRLTLRRRHP